MNQTSIAPSRAGSLGPPVLEIATELPPSTPTAEAIALGELIAPLLGGLEELAAVPGAFAVGPQPSTAPSGVCDRPSAHEDYGLPGQRRLALCECSSALRKACTGAGAHDRIQVLTAMISALTTVCRSRPRYRRWGQDGAPTSHMRCVFAGLQPWMTIAAAPRAQARRRSLWAA